MGNKWGRIARVFKPADAVIGFEKRVIHGVAVCHQNIGVTVSVQVNQLNPRGTPAWMGGLEKCASFETQAARTQKSDHRFVFLGNQRNKIEMTIVVEVQGGNVHGSVSLVDLVRGVTLR